MAKQKKRKKEKIYVLFSMFVWSWPATEFKPFFLQGNALVEKKGLGFGLRQENPLEMEV